jgi:hypothetical protein
MHWFAMLYKHFIKSYNYNLFVKLHMPSITKKTRPQRTLSSYLNTFNKENHLDFGNRAAQIPKKISSKHNV